MPAKLATSFASLAQLVRHDPAKLLFLLLVFALPFMRPAVHYPVIAADLLFLVVLAAFAAELALRRRTVRWRTAYWVLILYGFTLSASVVVSPDARLSLIKSAATFYLVTIAMLTDQIVRTRRDLKLVVLAWIAATAIVAALGVASLILFPFAAHAPLLDYTQNEYGTLHAGPYIRLRVTFFFASMMCNYLTVSLGLILLARKCGWIGRSAFVLLFAGTLIVGIASVSPGIGGLALAIGIWVWLIRRSTEPLLARLSLTGGAIVAVGFVAAMTFTPIAHITAPFRIHLADGIELFPAVRFLTWTAALHTWLSQPFLGHGLGIDPIMTPYQDPTGAIRTMADAHNILLSVAAQSGVVGLIGLIAVIALATRLTFRRADWNARFPIPLAIGLIFLNGFLYQGLGGSFEDARHLWLLLGLLLAADRLQAEAPSEVN
jgi:O-antigen ligase